MYRIDCEYIHRQILDDIKDKPKTGKLVIISVGDNPASEIYVRGKLKDAEYCGIEAEHIKYPEGVSSNEIVMNIAKLNWNPEIGGIIVQLPLPGGYESLFNAVAPIKDVDGFSFASKFKPCTPEAIVWLMEKVLGALEGMDVLLLGRGMLVGKPLINMLLEKNCTITVAHSHTKNVQRLTEQRRDCIISGVGKPNIFNMVNVNTKLVIDAGISRVEGKVVGDCYGCELGDFDYTSVPGGVGLLTRAFLMKHMVKKNDT